MSHPPGLMLSEKKSSRALYYLGIILFGGLLIFIGARLLSDLYLNLTNIAIKRIITNSDAATLGCLDDEIKSLVRPLDDRLLNQIQNDADFGYKLNKNPAFYRVLGITNVLQQDYKLAAINFATALPPATTNLTNYYWLGLVKECQGDLDGAVAAWQNIGMNAYLLERAKNYQLSGKYAKAEKAYNTALKLCSSSFCDSSDEAELWYNLATLYVDTGNHRKASDAITRAILVNDKPVYQVTLAMTLIDLKEYSAALEILEQLVNAYPGESIYHVRLGMLYEILGDNARAEEQLLIGANQSLGGNGGWAYLMLARFYYYTRQYAKGDETFYEAIELAPDLVCDHLNFWSNLQAGTGNNSQLFENVKNGKGINCSPEN